LLLPAVGLSTTVQELPFQTSINACVPKSVYVEPTATHHEVDTHDTDRKKPSRVPEVGLSTTVQELPSQVSINVSTPSTEPVEPTATHHEVDTHDTDDKELSPVSALGLGTIVSVSIAASAGVGITTEPSKSAETTTTLDSHIRIIRNSQRNVRLDLGKRYSNATTTRVFF
jgi:hypothetical protein